MRKLMPKANHLQSRMARLEFLEDHLLDPRVGRHFGDKESLAMPVRGMTDCDGLDSGGSRS